MLERIDLDRISREAHQIDIGRMLLTLLAGIFWLIGWSVAKVCILLVAIVTYSIAAMKVGWQDAHEGSMVKTGRRGAAA